MTPSLLVTPYGQTFGKGTPFPNTLTACFKSLDGIQRFSSVAQRLRRNLQLTYQVRVPVEEPTFDFQVVDLVDSSGSTLIQVLFDSPVTVLQGSPLLIDAVVPAYATLSEVSSSSATTSTPTQPFSVFSSMDNLPSVLEKTDPVVVGVVQLDARSSAVCSRVNGLWSSSLHYVCAEGVYQFDADQGTSRIDLDSQYAGVFDVSEVSLIQFLGDHQGLVRSIRFTGEVSPTSFSIQLSFALPDGVLPGERVLVLSRNSLARPIRDSSTVRSLVERVQLMEQEVSPSRNPEVASTQEALEQLMSLHASLSQKLEALEARVSALTPTSSSVPNRRGR